MKLFGSALIPCHRVVNVQFVEDLKFGVKKVIPAAFPLQLTLKGFTRDRKFVVISHGDPKIYHISWVRLSETNGKPFSFRRKVKK